MHALMGWYITAMKKELVNGIMLFQGIIGQA
jgi:hypothetical protein